MRTFFRVVAYISLALFTVFGLPLAALFVAVHQDIVPYGWDDIEVIGLTCIALVLEVAWIIILVSIGVL